MVNIHEDGVTDRAPADETKVLSQIVAPRGKNYRAVRVRVAIAVLVRRLVQAKRWVDGDVVGAFWQVVEQVAAILVRGRRDGQVGASVAINVDIQRHGDPGDADVVRVLDSVAVQIQEHGVADRTFASQTKVLVMANEVRVNQFNG